jgi:hypothetical protein
VLIQMVQGLHWREPGVGRLLHRRSGLLIASGELGAFDPEFTIGSTIQRMLQDVVEVGGDVEWLPMSARRREPRHPRRHHERGLAPGLPACRTAQPIWVISGPSRTRSFMLSGAIGGDEHDPCGLARRGVPEATVRHRHHGDGSRLRPVAAAVGRVDLFARADRTLRDVGADARLVRKACPARSPRSCRCGR